MRLLLGLLCLFYATPAFSEEGDVKIEPVTDGVWLHVSRNMFSGVLITSNGLIVQGDDGLYLVDSAWGDENTEMLLRKIKREIGQPVVAAVATHFHDDRTSGAEVLKAHGIPFYASAETRKLVTGEERTPPADALDIGTQPGADSKLGPLVVMYPGAAHATDNLVVWLPEQKLLFGGCAVRAQDAKDLGNYADGRPMEWDDAMERVIKAFGDAKTVIPGHGEVGGPELLTHTRDLARAHVAKE